MNNKNGFSLIELLAAIFIIGLLSGIAVVSYRVIFKTSEQKYYETIESNMMLAGNDYFTDHRELIPYGENYNFVSLSELVEKKYMDKVVDTSGITCDDGEVFIYRDNNHLKYEACLNNCGSYNSVGKFCDS